jgi:cell division protein FtsL
VTNEQWLHREHDPGARRILVAALACSTLLVGGALAVVGMRVQQVHVAYRLDELRAQRARAEGNVRQLEIEVATLRSPARVESRARQLGMIAPARDQIRLAREYVTGSTGLAGERSHTASLSGHLPTDPVPGTPLQQSSRTPLQTSPRQQPATGTSLQQ